MDLCIRKACLADAPACAEIHCRSWEAAYGGIFPADFIARQNAKRPEQCRTRFAGEHNTYVAVPEERVAGFCGLLPQAEEDGLPGWFRVGSLYVDPAQFRRGVGRQLLNFTAGLARAEHSPGVFLYVLEENLPARKFYEACGFAYDGERFTADFGGKALAELRYGKEL